MYDPEQRADRCSRQHAPWQRIFVALALGLAFLIAAPSAHAQHDVPFDAEKQEDLDGLHSGLQKGGLVTLGLTGLTGYTLLANKPTLFGEGRCKSGNPILGDFGCGGLKYLHAAFGASTLGLFVAQEIVAGEMPLSPYDVGGNGRQGVMTGLRYVNIGLFSVQPLLGFVAANGETFGLSQDTTKVLRTIHFGIGTTIAGTYTTNAVLQW